MLCHSKKNFLVAIAIMLSNFIACSSMNKAVYDSYLTRQQIDCPESFHACFNEILEMQILETSRSRNSVVGICAEYFRFSAGSRFNSELTTSLKEFLRYSSINENARIPNTIALHFLCSYSFHVLLSKHLELNLEQQRALVIQQGSLMKDMKINTIMSPEQSVQLFQQRPNAKHALENTPVNTLGSSSSSNLCNPGSFTVIGYNSEEELRAKLLERYHENRL